MLCARTLDNLKAENTVILDLRSIDSAPAEYFIISTANSETHARALTDALERATLQLGERRPRTEGRDIAEWVLLDYFDVVVHIFRAEAREYYKLEKLWGDALTVDMQHLEEHAGKQLIQSRLRTSSVRASLEQKNPAHSSRRKKSTSSLSEADLCTDSTGIAATTEYRVDATPSVQSSQQSSHHRALPEKARSSKNTSLRKSRKATQENE